MFSSLNWSMKSHHRVDLPSMQAGKAMMPVMLRSRMSVVIDLSHIPPEGIVHLTDDGWEFRGNMA